MGTLRWSLVALLLAAFFVRLIWLVPFPNIPPEFDQGTFLQESRVLAAQGLTKWKYDDRAPGYILFLAANLRLNNGNSLAGIRIAQSLLSVTMVAVVFALTQLLFAKLPKKPRDRVAFLAAILATFYPDYVFYSQLLWSETLFVFLTVFGFYLLLRGYRAQTDWRWFLASGICLGGALLAREVILAFVLVFIPLWLWLALPLQRGARVRLLVVFGVGVAALLAPWMLRNVAQGNGPELISWQGGRDFWKYNARMVRANIRVKSMEAALDKEPTGAAKNGRGYREGFALIFNNPLRWVLAKASNTAQLWSGAHSVALKTARHLKLVSRAVERGLEPYFDALGILWIVFTVIGFVYMRDTRALLLLAFFVLASLIAFFAIHYILRFRLGIVAPLFPLTAYGMAASAIGLRSFLRTRRIADTRRFVLTLFVVGMFLLGAI
jgi:4-amino-4-deoxy-L-arabinose transferase-like glycosyltransferase